MRAARSMSVITGASSVASRPTTHEPTAASRLPTRHTEHSGIWQLCMAPSELPTMSMAQVWDLCDPHRRRASLQAHRASRLGRWHTCRWLPSVCRPVRSGTVAFGGSAHTIRTPNNSTDEGGCASHIGSERRYRHFERRFYDDGTRADRYGASADPCDRAQWHSAALYGRGPV